MALYLLTRCWNLCLRCDKAYKFFLGAILLVNADEPEHAATRPDLAERFRRFKIVRNRWNVAYTLIKNPDLVKLRKKHRKDDCGENSSTETSFIMITTYK